MPKPTATEPLYSIVIPAFEEASLILGSLKKVHKFLEAENLLGSTEIVVVAAAGRDNTAAIVRTQGHLFEHFQLIKPGPRAGKGRDVKAGVQAARGQYIIFTDADLATPIYHCKQAFELLCSGQADVVIGVRDLWTIHKDLLRKLISVMANWLVRLFLLPRIPDSQCGFKGFTRPSADKLFARQTIEGWGFDMELLVIATSHKLKIKKVRIKDWSDPKVEMRLGGDSPIKVSISTFAELLRIWRQRLKGVYK